MNSSYQMNVFWIISRILQVIGSLLLLQNFKK